MAFGSVFMLQENMSNWVGNFEKGLTQKNKDLLLRI